VASRRVSEHLQPNLPHTGTMHNNNNVHIIAVYTAKVVQYALRMFALDKRSLALWRVLCGIVTIYDLLLRYPDIHNHYSDKGVLPRTLTLSNFQNQYWVSFHMISGTDFHMTVLFWVHMVIAFLLTVGTYLNLHLHVGICCF
jgi:hypothetical protein